MFLFLNDFWLHCIVGSKHFSYDFSSWEFFEICFIVKHIVSFYSSTYSLAPESRVYICWLFQVCQLVWDLLLIVSSLCLFLSAAERCMFKMSKYSYRLTVFPYEVLRFYHTEALLVGAFIIWKCYIFLILCNMLFMKYSSLSLIMLLGLISTCLVFV